MAVKADTSGTMKPQVKSAEDWAISKNVPGMYFAGVKAQNQWGKGKALTEKEFDAALKKFLDGAADGRKR